MSRDLNCLHEALRFSMLISKLLKYLSLMGVAAFVTEMTGSRDVTLVILPSEVDEVSNFLFLTYTSGPNIRMSIW